MTVAWPASDDGDGRRPVSICRAGGMGPAGPGVAERLSNARNRSAVNNDPEVLVAFFAVLRTGAAAVRSRRHQRCAADRIASLWPSPDAPSSSPRKPSRPCSPQCWPDTGVTLLTLNS